MAFGQSTGVAPKVCRTLLALAQVIKEVGLSTIMKTGLWTISSTVVAKLTRNP